MSTALEDIEQYTTDDRMKRFSSLISGANHSQGLITATFRNLKIILDGISECYILLLSEAIMKWVLGSELRHPIFFRFTWFFLPLFHTFLRNHQQLRLWKDLHVWANHDGPTPPVFVSVGSINSTLCFLLPRALVILVPEGFARLRSEILRAVFEVTLILTPLWLTKYIMAAPSWFHPRSRSTWVCWFVLLLTSQNYGVIFRVAGLVFLFWFAIAPYLPAPRRYRFIPNLAMFIFSGLISLPLAFYCGYWPQIKMPWFWMKDWLRISWKKFVQRPSGRNQHSQRYLYRQLKPGSIRLLDLRRDLLTRKLRCSLRHATLKEGAQYDAISYTWGTNSTKMYDIQVDDGWLQVTLNAHSVLQDRASFFETRTIWIDCICIDQSNLKEKNVQVPLMDQIYQLSKRAIVFLDGGLPAEQAFSLMHEMVRIQSFKCIIDSYFKKKHEESPFMSNKKVLAATDSILASIMKEDPRYPALTQAINHHYFSRVWIVQEIFFSPQCHIRCNGCWIDWKNFSRFVSRLMAKQLAVRLTPIFNLALMKGSRTIRGHLGTDELKPSVCSLLVRPWTSKLKASDPRDLVYGLLSLSKEAQDPDFAPDYTSGQDPVDFYTGICKKFLRRSQYQDVFIAAGIGRHRLLKSLPSWVPDWTATHVEVLVTGRQYHAAGTTKADIRLVGHSNLTVRGLYVDRIVSLSAHPLLWNSDNITAYEPHQVAGHVLTAVFEALRLSKCLNDEAPDENNPYDSRWEAVWRTILGDAIPKPVDEDISNACFQQGFAVTDESNASVYPTVEQCRAGFETWRHFLLIPPVRLILEEEMSWDSASHIRRVSRLTDLMLRDKDLSEKFQAVFDDECINLLACVCDHRFAITEKGYVGMVPPRAMVGDNIFIVYGFGVPYLFRPGAENSNGKVFQLVGKSYVHGVMNGEMLRETTGTASVLLVA